MVYLARYVAAIRGSYHNAYMVGETRLTDSQVRMDTTLGCSSCQQRKSNIRALLDDGRPLPRKDKQFYLTLIVGLAVLVIIYFVWSKDR